MKRHRLWLRLNQGLAKTPLNLLLTVPFLLQLLGAVGLISYLSYRSGERSVSILADNLLKQTVSRVEDQLNAYLQTPHSIVKLNLANMQAGDLDPQNIQQLERILFRQLRQFPTLTTLSFGYRNGEVIGVGRDRSGVVVSPGAYTIWENLGSIPRTRRFYEVNEQRQRLKLTHTDFNFDVCQRSWYRTALKSRQQTWAPIFPIVGVPAAIVSAVAPVYQNGELQGVISSDLTLSDISLFLSSLKFSRHGQAFIIERSQNLVATSTQEKIFTKKDSKDGFIRLNARDSQDKVTQAAAQAISKYWQNLSTIRQLQRFDFRLDGERQFGQIVPYQDQYGLDWLIVTVIPASDFMAEIDATHQQTWLLAGVTLLLAIATGLLTTRWIAAPIRNLQRVAKAIAEGDLSHPVKIGGVGEVAQLSNWFEKMTRQLAQAEQLRTNYEQELRQQVRSQTEALHRSEERFRLAVKHAPDVFVIYDSECRFLYMNERGLERLGQSLETLMGKREEDVLPPELVEQTRPILQQTITTKTLQTGECEVPRPGDIPLAFIVRYVPLLDNQGEIQQIMGITFDISDRKQMEVALRDSQEQFRQVTENLPLFFGLRAIDYSQWLYVSPMFEHLTGRSLQIMLDDPQSWRSFIHPDDQPTIAVTPEHSEPATHEFRIFRSNQEVRWIRTLEFPVFQQEGKPYRVAVFGEDITERKQIEADLRTSEERFRKAFDHAPIGIALVALTGQFLQVNPSFCDIVGYSAAELMTLTWQAITHPDDLNFNLQRHQQLVAGDVQSYQLEKRYVHQQGKIVPVLLNVALLRDQDGDPLYTITHVVDMSDRYEVNRIKDEFISIVSHELRTPLTAISGSLSLLESGLYDEEPEQFKEMLHIASNNSVRLVRLVNDILDLERLESGRVQFVMEACPIAQVIQQALESVQPIADDANITLSTSFVPTTIWASPDAIVQTLVNLLSNAIKFSAAGSTVWLNAEADSLSSTHSILFTVKDQGRGIPSDKLRVIFERFQQVDASDSRQKGGTGLGLAICKTIVNQHRGQIWVESVVGQGSMFYFTVPVCLDPSQDEA